MAPRLKLNLKDNLAIIESFLKMIVKSVIQNPANNYTKEISYVDRSHGSMVIKICNGKEYLTLSKHGEGDDNIELHGPMAFIKEFLAELAIEASILITQELCGNIFDGEGECIFANTVADKIRNGISASFSKCNLLVTEN